MITTINKKALAALYNMSSTTLYSYMRDHNDKIKALGQNRKKNNGRTIHSRSFNSKQLKYIIENVMGDSPEGYEFNGQTLVKCKTE